MANKALRVLGFACKSLTEKYTPEPEEIETDLTFIGLQATIAIVIASFLKWNKIAAGIAVFNTNVLTGPFIFGISYFIGASALGYTNTINFPDRISLPVFWNLFTQSHEIFLSLCFGGVVLGIPASILVYYLAHWAIKNYRLRMARNKYQRALN